MFLVIITVAICVVIVMCCFSYINIKAEEHGYDKAVEDIMRRKWYWDRGIQSYINVDANITEEDAYFYRREKFIFEDQAKR